MSKPVAWMDDMSFFTEEPEDMDGVIPLYTHPVKQLSDERITELWSESQNDSVGMSLGFSTQEHYFANLIIKEITE